MKHSFLFKPNILYKRVICHKNIHFIRVVPIGLSERFQLRSSSPFASRESVLLGSALRAYRTLLKADFDGSFAVVR